MTRGEKNPRFLTLSRDECMAILARNHVGRLAYAVESRVEIKPLNYVYRDGWIYGRTSPGAQLAASSESWAPVAFEVDEVEELFRWRSVVVHGGFYTMADDGLALHDEEWWHGVQLLRTLIPGTFSGDDPVRFRMVLFRLAVQEITGREAVPGQVPAPAEAVA
ncbi:MAG TPA: pyridoxamine 5'-phosphate oxidase family protein [Longimicrobium sp.]|nr:pyridoxamine 5'-phosphate oxidase family protein [Longimicrobium sp.]